MPVFQKKTPFHFIRKFYHLALVLIFFSMFGCQAYEAAPAATATPTETLAPTPANTPTPGFQASPTPAITPTPLNLEGGITTADGLQFLELTAGNGKKPQPGEIVVMNYRATLPDGTEVLNSSLGNTPTSLIYNNQQLLPGWYEGLGLMSEGGKARMILPANLAFGSQPPSNVPPNSPIILEVELVKVKPIPVPAEVPNDNYKTLSDGLQFYDLQVGDGRLAVKSLFATMLYTVWVKGETGNTFITAADSDSPIFFLVGSGGTVVKGWDEGVVGMKVGGKRQLVIPPELGYGVAGGGNIPANATLIIELELTKVSDPAKQTDVDPTAFTTTSSGLQYYDIQVGVGPNPSNGQTLVVNYTGWLENGVEFDSTSLRGKPFIFKLGAGQVIKGWEEGLAGMQLGGKRKLIVPSGLAYGKNGAGNIIPGDTNLVFEIELIEIRP